MDNVFCIRDLLNKTSLNRPSKHQPNVSNKHIEKTIYPCKLDHINQQRTFNVKYVQLLIQKIGLVIQ